MLQVGAVAFRRHAAVTDSAGVPRGTELYSARQGAALRWKRKKEERSQAPNEDTTDKCQGSWKPRPGRQRRIPQRSIEPYVGGLPCEEVRHHYFDRHTGPDEPRRCAANAARSFAEPLTRLDGASPSYRFSPRRRSVSVARSPWVAGGSSFTSPRATCGGAIAFHSIVFPVGTKQAFCRIVLVSFLLSLGLIPQAAHGQTTLYWDPPGGTNPTPSGPWNATTSNWSADSNGGSQTTWVDGSSAFFAAGELAATGNYTITLNTNVTVADLTYTVGNVGSTLQIAVGAGNIITMANPVMNVTVDPGTTLVIAPVIAGTGNLNLAGGTLALTAANTYTGGTTITTGSLRIGNGGTTGSILGDVIDNANLGFNRSDNITFSNNISGTGSLSQFGTGMVTLTGTNSYIGGTNLFGVTFNVAGGTLSVATDAELGDPAGGISLEGGELLTTTNGFSSARAITVLPSVGLSTLAAATGTTATYTGFLSGPGGALVIGDAVNKGTVVFTENNTYNGGTAIFTGVTLQLGNGGTTGSIVGNIPDAGTVAFDRSDPITFAGTISGLGTLSQIGSGTLTLTASNLYRGGTFISGNGTVSVATNANLGITTGVIGGITLQGGELLTTGAASTFTTARGIVLNTAVGPDILAAVTTTTATYTGVVSGPGALIVGDGTHTGTAVFTRANGYLGGTTINGATLQLGNGVTTGSILGNVTDNGNFAFAPGISNAATFSGAVSGSGTLRQIGPGTLTLTNPTNSYSGGTFVLGGTLSVDTDAELGLTTGGITLQSGELLTTADGFTTARTVGISSTGTLAATSGTTATYSGLISGTSGALTVGDGTHTGTIVFTGNNTYSGGTIIAGGVLSVGGDANLGATSGGITLHSGELLTTADGFTTGRTVDVSSTGILATTTGTTATYSGLISDTGALVIGDGTHTGTVVFTGNNTYSGETTINVGTLEIGSGVARVASWET